MNQLTPAQNHAANSSTAQSKKRPVSQPGAQAPGKAPPAIKLRGHAKTAAMLQYWTALEWTAKASRAERQANKAKPAIPAAPALRAIVPPLKLAVASTPTGPVGSTEVRSARVLAGSPRSPFAVPGSAPVTPSPSPRSTTACGASPVPGSNSSSGVQTPPVTRPDSPRDSNTTPSPRTQTAAALLREAGLAREGEFAALEEKIRVAPLSKLFTDASMPAAWFARFCETGTDIFGEAAEFLTGGLKATAMDPVAIAGACAGAASVFFSAINLKEGVSASGLPSPLAAMLGELVEEVQYRHLQEKSSVDDVSVVLANLFAAALVAKVNPAYREQARGFLLAAMGQPGQLNALVLKKTALTLQEKGGQVLGAICEAGRTQRINVRLRDYSLLAGREEQCRSIFADVCRPSKDGMDGAGDGSAQVQNDLPAALRREMASGTSVIAFVDGGLNKLMQHADDFNQFKNSEQKKTLTELCNQRLMVRLAAEINRFGCIKDITGQTLVPSTGPRSTYTIKQARDGSLILSTHCVAYVDKAKVFGSLDTKPLATIGKFELRTTVLIDVKGVATLKEARLDTRNINQLVEWDSPQGKQIMASSSSANTTASTRPVKS